MAIRSAIRISLEQAQAIIQRHCPSDTPLELQSLTQFQDSSFSSLTSVQAYLARTTRGLSHLLKVAASPQSEPPVYSPNTLELQYALAQKLSKFEDIPQENLIAFDPSQSIIPYPYILSEYAGGLTLAEASSQLTERQSLLLNIRLGSYFKRVHEELQNDWFGLASQEKDELYSWQEAFTYLLETVLQDAQDFGEELPYEDIRRYLSRAIGFFLFDDCEVPSLVSFLGDENSITVDFDPASLPENDEIPITSALSLSHALWGDPLLETMFLNPNQAFLEGYGGSPIVFARQKTKRMWYTVFQALVVLVQSHRLNDTELNTLTDRREWARKTVVECARDLENAPCY